MDPLWLAPFFGSNFDFFFVFFRQKVTFYHFFDVFWGHFSFRKTPLFLIFWPLFPLKRLFPSKISINLKKIDKFWWFLWRHKFGPQKSGPKNRGGSGDLHTSRTRFWTKKSFLVRKNVFFWGGRVHGIFGTPKTSFLTPFWGHFWVIFWLFFDFFNFRGGVSGGKTEIWLFLSFFYDFFTNFDFIKMTPQKHPKKDPRIWTPLERVFLEFWYSKGFKKRLF